MALPTERRRQFYKSFEAKALMGRSFLTRFADDLTAIFGSSTFLFLNAVFFAIWIIINTEILSSIIPIKAFDPFPFGLLTMIVSLEAIFLSIFVLVSQNRSSYVGSVRDELHLQVNLIAEEEITEVLQILSEIRSKVGITEEDKRLEKMLKRIDTNYIEKSLVEQMTKANKPIAEGLIKALSRDFPDLFTPTASIAKAVPQVVPKVVTAIHHETDLVRKRRFFHSSHPVNKENNPQKNLA